jgi:hypothetical protein
MVSIIIFLAFGWKVMSDWKPFYFAAWCAAVFSVFYLVRGGSFMTVLLAAVVNFALYSAIFWLADRFLGEIIRPISILIVD